jgi:hypothetical protein
MLWGVRSMPHNIKFDNFLKTEMRPQSAWIDRTALAMYHAFFYPNCTCHPKLYETIQGGTC